MTVTGLGTMGPVLQGTLPYGTNIREILRGNPQVRDDSLRGVIEANIVGFDGRISVSTQMHAFASGRKQARVIYITPYKNKVDDFLVSVRRFFSGIQFPQISLDGSHVSNIQALISGELLNGTREYETAKREITQAIDNGMRFSFAIANDGSDASVVFFEKNQAAVCPIL